MVSKKKRIPWNKGLTKETEPKLREIGRNISKAKKEKYRKGEIVPWNNGLTKETDKRVAETGEKISKALKGKESIFRGHNWGWCKKCGKYHKHGGDKCAWSKGHNYKGICKKCGKQHFPDSFFEEQSKRMRENNPMFKQENIDKMIESTDYEKLGSAISLTIKGKKEKGIYKSPITVFKKNNPEKYTEICEQTSERMKINNPMFNPITAQKVGETLSILHGEGKIDYNHSEEEKINLSKRMKINNPMFSDDVKERVGKKIAILWATNPEWIERKDTMLMNDPKIVEKASNSLRERWKDKEFKMKMLENHRRRPNNLELNFLEFCKNNNFPFKYVGDGKFWIYGEVSKKGRNPDFINTELKKVILVGAKYWHSNEEEEKLEMMDYLARGFKVLHIWEDDFTNNLSLVKLQVENFLKE